MAPGPASAHHRGRRRPGAPRVPRRHPSVAEATGPATGRHGALRHRHRPGTSAGRGPLLRHRPDALARRHAATREALDRPTVVTLAGDGVFALLRPTTISPRVASVDGVTVARDTHLDAIRVLAAAAMGTAHAAPGDRAAGLGLVVSAPRLRLARHWRSVVCFGSPHAPEELDRPDGSERDAESECRESAHAAPSSELQPYHGLFSGLLGWSRQSKRLCIGDHRAQPDVFQDAGVRRASAASVHASGGLIDGGGN